MSNLYYPPLIHPNRDARNGMYPATSFYGRLQQAHNHLVGYRHKTVFQRQWRLGNKTYSGAASTNLAPTARNLPTLSVSRMCASAAPAEDPSASHVRTHVVSWNCW